MKKRINFKQIVVLFISVTILLSLIQIKKTEAVSNGGDPYLGQISLFPYGFAPTGWVKCEGQQISIQQNTALFALIGVNFGGNGTTTFNLPNLTNASPIEGAAYYIAMRGIFPSRDYGYYDGCLGEIAMFPYNFTPGGWVECKGQTLQIAENDVLYSVLGTMFGGNGSSDFAVPDLQNCSPIDNIRYYISTTGRYPDVSRGYGFANEEFMGSIDLFPNNYIAQSNQNGYCNGQVVNMNNNQALYSLLGTTFGGNGTSNFMLPDLRGAAPDPQLKYFMQMQGIYPSRY